MLQTFTSLHVSFFICFTLIIFIITSKKLVKFTKIKVIIIKDLKHFRCNKPVKNISQYHQISINKYFTNIVSFIAIKTKFKDKRTAIKKLFTHPLSFKVARDTFQCNQVFLKHFYISFGCHTDQRHFVLYNKTFQQLFYLSLEA